MKKTKTPNHNSPKRYIVVDLVSEHIEHASDLSTVKDYISHQLITNDTDPQFIEVYEIVRKLDYTIDRTPQVNIG